MALQGKILFIITLAFFAQKVRCDVEHTDGAHMFLTRGIDNVDEDEAADQIDTDDEGDVDIPATTTSAPIWHSSQETIYEDLYSPEAMQFLTEEHVGLIETGIAAQTVDTVVEKMKNVLTDKRSVRNFNQIRGEIYRYMKNPKTPKMVKGFLEERYKCYVNEKTPDLMREKYDAIKTFVNNENIPKHIQFLKQGIVNFLTKPGDVRKRIADQFTLLSRLLHIPPIFVKLL